MILALIQRSQIIPVGGGGPASEATVKVVPCNDADDLVGALFDDEQLSEAHLDESLRKGIMATVSNIDPGP